MTVTAGSGSTVRVGRRWCGRSDGHLAAMNGRGVPANELADLVGDITVTEVRRLIKAHKEFVKHHGDTAAGESAVGCRG